MRRPAKFKLDAFRYWIDGAHPTVAFEMASNANGGIKLSGCMTNRSWSSSYMSDDIRNWIKRQRDLGNTEVLTYLEKYEIVIS